MQQQPGLDRARQQGRSSRLPGIIGCPISPSSLLPSSPILTLGTCPLQRHTQQTREPTRPLRLGCSPQQIFSTSTPLPSRGTGQLGAQYPTTDMRHGPNETHGNRQHDLVSSRWADCHVSFRSMIPLRASSPPPRLVPSAVGSPSSGPWPMAEGRCNGLMLALPSPEDHRPVGLRSPQHMEQREVSDKSEVELPERFLLCSRISIRHRRPEGAGRERRQDNLTATTTTATMTPTEPTGRFPAVQHHDAACLAARHGSVSQSDHRVLARFEAFSALPSSSVSPLRAHPPIALGEVGRSEPSGWVGGSALGCHDARPAARVETRAAAKNTPGRPTTRHQLQLPI